MDNYNLIVVRAAYDKTVYAVDFDTPGIDTDAWQPENGSTVTNPGDRLVVFSQDSDDDTRQASKALPLLVLGRKYTYTAIVSSPDVNVSVGLDVTGSLG